MGGIHHGLRLPLRPGRSTSRPWTCSYRDVMKMMINTSEVCLCIREYYVVQITLAFKCTDNWPHSVAQWPLPHIPWLDPNRVAEVKAEGFNLLFKECYTLIDKQRSAESDAWVTPRTGCCCLGAARNKCLSLFRSCRTDTWNCLGSLSTTTLPSSPFNGVGHGRTFPCTGVVG